LIAALEHHLLGSRSGVDHVAVRIELGTE
jgi:hypothetical protein